jgi:type IV pilus assembly protein PilW
MRARFHPTMRGLSLVDLIVGLAIGMVATLVILNVMVMFDARRRATAGSSDAQVNAVFAAAVLSRELRIAGHGLGPPAGLGCTVHRAAAGTAEASFLLAPAQILNGSDGSPDTLIVLAAGEQALPAARLIAPHSMGSNVLTLDSTLGVVPDGQLLLQSPGSPDCALLTVASVSVGAYTVQADTVSGLLDGAVYGTDSPVVNLGALRYRRYRIDANQRLQAEIFDSDSGSWLTSTLADGVVNLQLQYGFDGRTGVQTTPQVTRWSDTMIDADGNGATANAGDWQRMLAVRFAVVTRSAQRKDEACDSPTPSWIAGNLSTGELESTAIKVDHLSDWQCWRYRVLQTEIPLRNQLWSDQ